MTNTVAVIWPDGVVHAAPSWDELEDVVRTTQWEEYTTREEFRKQMAFRARNWSGTEIDTNGTSHDFFCELERAGMLNTVDGHGKEVDSSPRAPRPPVDLTLWRTGGRDLEALTELMEKDS